MTDREIVLRAAKSAARNLYQQNQARPEAQLVAGIERAIEGPTRREWKDKSLPVLDWKRQPGGVDLAVLEQGAPRLLIEMKVGHLDQSLWDIFKLASLLRHARIASAFLVYEAPRETFMGGLDCAKLFTEAEGSPTPVAAVDLVRRWPNAWADLLAGGYGNHPRHAVANLMLSKRGEFPLFHHPTREIRVLEIENVDTELACFDETGWLADLGLDERAASSSSSGPHEQPGIARLPGVLEVPKPFPRGAKRQEWCKQNIPRLSDEQYHELLEVLRSRGWNEGELDEWIRPHRPPRSTAKPDGPPSPVPSPAPPPEPPIDSPQPLPPPERTPGESAVPQAPPDRVELPDLIERVMPAVVQVVALRRKPEGTGSGFAIPSLPEHDGQTVLVTNAHVTKAGNRFAVRWGTDDFYKADLLVEASDEDIAILLVPIPPPAVLPIRSARDVRVGEEVIAVGSPHGLTETVTAGIVSAKGRTVPTFSKGVVENAIQTNADIHPGNSGGPLIGRDGMVLGINTQGLTAAAGLNFAIPAENARRLYVNARR